MTPELTPVDPPAPLAGFAYRGHRVRWDKDGKPLDNCPYVVVADVRPGRVELVFGDGGEDDRVGRYYRYFVVPVGESRPVPGFAGWRAHCDSVYTADPTDRAAWHTERAYVHLSFEG